VDASQFLGLNNYDKALRRAIKLGTSEPRGEDWGNGFFQRIITILLQYYPNALLE